MYPGCVGQARKYQTSFWWWQPLASLAKSLPFPLSQLPGPQLCCDLELSRSISYNPATTGFPCQLHVSWEVSTSFEQETAASVIGWPSTWTLSIMKLWEDAARGLWIQGKEQWANILLWVRKEDNRARYLYWRTLQAKKTKIKWWVFPGQLPAGQKKNHESKFKKGPKNWNPYNYMHAPLTSIPIKGFWTSKQKKWEMVRTQKNLPYLYSWLPVTLFQPFSWWLILYLTVGHICLPSQILSSSKTNGFFFIFVCLQLLGL